MSETIVRRMAADTLRLPLEIKTGSIEAQADGSFSGYGSIFGNRDRDGDIVAPGAFAESLKGRTPALLWQHDQKTPIGRFDEVREDTRGLYVRGQLAMSGRGKEAYDLLKMEALNGLSIGFVAKEASRDPATGLRTIHKADLMEVSLVTFPANEMARVQTVKSAPTGDALTINDPRSFERLLRDNGFSRSRAKAITSKGFHFATPDKLPGEEIAELVSCLEQRKLSLEGKRRGLKKYLEVADAVTDVLGVISNAHRKVNGTPQPIRLFEGDSATFTLGLRSFDNPTVKILQPRSPGFHYFECVVKYWRWTSNGPVLERDFLYFRKNQLVNSKRLSTGSFADIRAWLKREIERTRKGGTTPEYDVLELMGRLRSFLANPAPHGRITYNKYFLEGPIGADARRSQHGFRIIAR